MIGKPWLKKVLLTAVFMTLMVFVANAQNNRLSSAELSSEQTSVLIGFNERVNTSLIAQAGGEVDHVFTRLEIVEARVPVQAIQGLRNNPQISFVESNQAVKALETIPWGIERIFASENQLRDTWQDTSGENTKVAVLDTGIDGAHSDLNVVGGVNFVNSEPYDVDLNTHGTHVAGIIAALNQGSGIAGVAPGVSLYSVTVLNSEGSGFISDVIKGIEWAMDEDIAIINMSLGAEEHSEALLQMVDAAFAAGHLLIGAAGNEGTFNGNGDTVAYPARYQAVIAVAASTQNDNRATFSSHGPDIELIAPGSNIHSTLPGDTYGNKNGTSMAAPHVAGVAALMWSINPNLSNEEIRQILRNTAEDIGLKSEHQGYGLVDGYAAFNEAKTHFEEIYYTITVSDGVDGSISPSGTFTVASGSEITFDITPDTGYEITDIFVNNEAVAIENPLTLDAVTDDITLEVLFSPIVYSIQFETASGSDVATLHVPYGETIEQPDDPEKTGYSFIGWYLDLNDDDPYVFDTMPAENLTLYALWEINTYDIYFRDAQDDLIKTMRFTFNDDLSEVTLPSAPHKIGHTFIGYDAALPATMPAYDLVLRAQYEVNIYKISFDTQGGTEIDPIMIAYNETIELPDDPQKDGVTFKAWLWGDNLFENETMPATDISLTATYTNKTYEIFFYDLEDRLIDSISVPHGSDLEGLTLPSAPEETGKTFTGWNPVLPESMPENNLTVVASYDLVIYTIQFDTGGGSFIGPLYAHYGDAITLDNTPEKQGHVFVEWHKDKEPFNLETMPAEDLVLTASYEEEHLVITGVEDGERFTVYDEIYLDFNGIAELNNQRIDPGRLEVEAGQYILVVDNGVFQQEISFTVDEHPYQSLDVIIFALIPPLTGGLAIFYGTRFTLRLIGLI